MAVIHESCTWYWRQHPVDQSKRLWRSARVQTVLLKRKQRTVRRTRMSLQNSTDELTSNEAWRFSSADLRRMIEDLAWKGGGARNDVNHVMLMYVLVLALAVSSHAKPLRCSRWTQSAEDNASEVKWSARDPTCFLLVLQNYFVYATVVLLLVLKEKSDDITIWITQISCQWSKISFDIVCYMLEKYNLDKYPLWYFFNWQILNNTNT